MTETTRWWLIRHAPVPNPDGRIHGQEDVAADTSDEAAFRALAAGLPQGAVWLTTHLSRTVATAAAIRAAWTGGMVPAEEPAVVPALAEQHFGRWQGLTHAEVGERHPRASHRFWQAPATGRPPGGESFADVAARVGPALLALSLEHAGRDVVAVVHAGTIRAALHRALDLTPDAALRLAVDPLSLTRIDAFVGPGAAVAWRVAGVNLPPAAFPGPVR